MCHVIILRDVFLKDSDNWFSDVINILGVIAIQGIIVSYLFNNIKPARID
jgi:hypothetical protein